MTDLYVATRRIKVGDEFREPGDPVPEAASWPTLRELLQGGYLQLVTDVEGSFHPEGFGFHVDPASVKLVSINEWERLMAMEKMIQAQNGDLVMAPQAPEAPERTHDPSQGGESRQQHSTGLSLDAGMDPRLASPAQVKKFAVLHPEMAESLLEAEKAGKNRMNVINALEEILTNPDMSTGGINE